MVKYKIRKVLKKEKYKIRKVLKEEKYDYEYFCDWCNSKIEENNFFETNEFTIEWKIGIDYPEGGSGVEKSFDLCIPCREKLFNKFKKMGIKIDEEKYKW